MDASDAAADAMALPRGGERAVIRARHWRVAWITPHGDCASIRVASDDPRIAPVTYLHPFDVVRTIPRPHAVPRVSRRQAVAALRRAIVGAAPFPALIATSPASIDLLPYQLEPALALLAGTATRVLLADDVGLGKTIQAGIAIQELAARSEANHALVVVPAGLVDQWADELAARFGLTAERVDATWLRLMARGLPPWVSPWSVPGVMLVSIDLLKRREVIAQVEHAPWDLVVIDEAHRATGATDRHRAASHVCARARRVLLLTATPHAGDAEAFRQIQELGSIPGDDLRTLTFARTRSAVAPSSLRRRARYLRVQLTREERLMHSALDRYVARMVRTAQGSNRDAIRLAMMVLKKRALSGAFSLRRSLARRLASVREAPDTPAQLGLRFDSDPFGELVADDEEPDAVLRAGRPDAIPREADRLARLVALASAAAGRESKLRLLCRALAITHEPAIVFTEYRDTLEHVAREVASITPPVLLHGGLAPDERRAALSAFTRGTARVLIATDAAAEGLNLHERCRWVINLELPWAPLRLIQRAGRVDRIGQRRRVHAWHLVADGTDETRLLLSLSTRAEAAASALAMERAIGEQAVGAALLDGADPVTDGAGMSLRLAPAPLAQVDREKARLEKVRALGRGNQFPARSGIARVRRRRGFARYAPRDRLLVFCGRALDGQGCIVSTRLGLAGSAIAAASNDLERALKGDLTRQERAAAVAATRNRAVASVLERSRPPVQPALFDRRALDSRDASGEAIAAARRQLGIPAAGSPTLIFDLVAGFEVT